MNAMNADQWNIFVAALLLGAPLVLISGPVIRHMALCLLWLALLFSHPALGFLTGAAIVVLYRPLRWFIEGTFAGLGAGLGLRFAGFAQRLSIPARRRERVQRYRRPPRSYEPNDSWPGEPWPGNLDERE
jgi:hypothetical protein